MNRTATGVTIAEIGLGAVFIFIFTMRGGSFGTGFQNEPLSTEQRWIYVSVFLIFVAMALAILLIAECRDWRILIFVFIPLNALMAYALYQSNAIGGQIIEWIQPIPAIMLFLYA